MFPVGESSPGVFLSPSIVKRRDCRATAVQGRPVGGCSFGEPSSRVWFENKDMRLFGYFGKWAVWWGAWAWRVLGLLWAIVVV